MPPLPLEVTLVERYKKWMRIQFNLQWPISAQCDISERSIVLKNGSVHEVPICNPIIKYADGKMKKIGNQIKLDRYICTQIQCTVCRCDISRGYKLSKNGRRAKCVMYCPITKKFSKKCFKMGTATVCYEWFLWKIAVSSVLWSSNWPSIFSVLYFLHMLFINV